jgi:hypothetical protein
MSAVSPLIADWIREGLEWKWVFQPAVQPFTVAPGKMRIPTEDYVFSAPEGTLVYMAVVFNSPYGGISMEAEPNLDFKERNTIHTHIALGNTAPNNMTYVNVPPVSGPGLYTIISSKEWPWVRSCRLFVVNEGAAPITCIGYAYVMALLVEERRMSLSKLFALRAAYDYFPQLRETILKMIEGEARRYLYK